MNFGDGLDAREIMAIGSLSVILIMSAGLVLRTVDLTTFLGVAGVMTPIFLWVMRDELKGRKECTNPNECELGYQKPLM